MSGNPRYTTLSLGSALLLGASFPVVVHEIGSWGAGGVLATMYGVAALVTFVLVAARHGARTTLSVSFSLELLTRMVLFLGQIVPLYVAIEIVDRAFLGGVLLCFFVWPVLALGYVTWFTTVKVKKRIALFVGASFMFLALAVEFWEQALIGLSEEQNAVAYVLALIAANSCALYAAVTRRFGFKGRGDLLTPVLCLLAALCGVALSVGNPDRHIMVFSWPLALVGAATGLAQVFWDASVRRGDALAAQLAASLTPWMAIFFASAFVGVSLIERVQECGVLLAVALFSIGLVVVSSRSADRESSGKR